MVFRSLFIAMVFLYNIAAVSADQSVLFESGMKAFQQGRYQQAIAYFNQAKTRGYNQIVVEYNLGVSHYKLGQYQQAERAFRKALASKELKQLVEYNLGLVKLKQKQKREAVEWFKQAAADKSTPKVAALAEQMLARYQTRTRKKNFLDGGIHLAYGHDSNVTQATTGSPSQQSDEILETYAYLNVLFKYADAGLHYYAQDFANINSNDFSQIGAKLGFPFRLDKWRITPSLGYMQNELDNEDYQSIYDLRLEMKRRIGKGDYVRFRYRFSDIVSENSLYDYLDGLRHQVRADYYTITELGRFRFRYEYEVNDRENTLTRNYSPIRHSLRIQLKNSLTTRFRLKNELIVRNSVYEAAQGFIREDDRIQYRFNLYHIPTPGLELGVRYHYTDNDSNLATEVFSRNVSQLYLNYYF
ncbi:MAG: tetratricopeptide repeat protein [Thioalkalispiraceae bacterium]|jgi:hypothetical protein